MRCCPLQLIIGIPARIYSFVAKTVAWCLTKSAALFLGGGKFFLWGWVCLVSHLVIFLVGLWYLRYGAASMCICLVVIHTRRRISGSFKRKNYGVLARCRRKCSVWLFGFLIQLWRPVVHTSTQKHNEWAGHSKRVRSLTYLLRRSVHLEFANYIRLDVRKQNYIYMLRTVTARASCVPALRGYTRSRRRGIK